MTDPSLCESAGNVPELPEGRKLPQIEFEALD